MQCSLVLVMRCENTRSEEIDNRNVWFEVRVQLVSATLYDHSSNGVNNGKKNEKQIIA